MALLLSLIVWLCCQTRLATALNTKSFPDDFLFGVASSAYQVEGAWNESGKGEGVWDRFTHTHPEKILDGSSGDIACDSYHKIKEDVALIKSLGVDFYRFSISWSRLLPLGYAHYVNPDGIRYYNELIDELIANGIKPMATLYHWDLPQNLLRIGGWTNSIIGDIFEDYARIAFENFGDRVPYWVTINTGCGGYANENSPPAMNQPGIADYLCVHETIKAHAKVYRLYDREFRSQQKGQVGITIDPRWYEPKTNSEADVAATERARQFSIGWLANPIYHKDGDYPQIMKDRIGYRSKNEGFLKSRLPEFTPEEKSYINGAFDFLGVNIYTTNLISDKPEDPFEEPAYRKDVRVKISQDPKWTGSSADWLKVVPQGVRTFLKWLKEIYGNPPIIITESGFADDGRLEDLGRINLYELYLSSVLDAIHEDEVNVKGFTAWTLLDNFEWNDGYTQSFGLHHVDFNDPGRPRTPKKSAKRYKEIVAQKRLERPLKEDL